MRAKVAKVLRRTAYKMAGGKDKYVENKGTRECAGPRKIYQGLKRKHIGVSG